MEIIFFVVQVPTATVTLDFRIVGAVMKGLLARPGWRFILEHARGDIKKEDRPPGSSLVGSRQSLIWVQIGRTVLLVKALPPPPDLLQGLVYPRYVR